MKRFYLSNLVLLITILAGLTSSTFAQSVTYVATGAAQFYTVPAGVTSVSVDMAGGGGGNSNGSGIGGKAGRVVCQLSVTPLSVLQVNVGKAGANYVCCGVNAGGFNGGGSGYQYGGGGGGGSDIRSGAYAVGNRLVVASGGGGGGYNWSNEIGGAGGGLSGTIGTAYSGAPSNYSGQPGTQVCCAAGASYCCGCSNSGALFQGGGVTCGYGGGGGGGGYYGGGSGDYYTPGGGGSAYITDPKVSGAVTTPAYQSGDGYVTITGPTLFLTPTALNFGVQTVGTLSVPKFFQVTGVNLTAGPISVTAPAGYKISTDGITWGSSASITYTPPSLSANLYVQFAPTFAISYCGGTVNFSGGSAPSVSGSVCGTGVAACSSLPSAGAAIVTPTTGNSTTTFTLADPSATTGGSIAYQWQMSTDAGVTWNDINGAVFQTSTFTGITGNTQFRLHVTCPSSGTSTSTTASVTFGGSGLKASSCTPSELGCCTGCGFVVCPGAGNPFVMNGESPTQINDANAWVCGTAYRDETLSQSVTMLLGKTYTCTNGYSLNNSEAFSVWIDFNNDGVFDNVTELVGGFNSPCCVIFPTTNVVIPSTGVQPGSYRMRVQVDYNCCGAPNYPSYPAQDPCTVSTEYADTRDYTVNIITPPCSGIPNPGISWIPVTSGCGPFNSNLYGVGGASGNGITSTWQTSSAPGGPWTPISPSANLATYTYNAAGTIYVQNMTTCAFGGSSATPATLLTVNPQPLPITGVTTFCTANPTTLTDATPGGSWASSNMAVASVGSTGVVTGLGAGTSTISYTLPAGCFSTTTVTVYLTPAPITGPSNVCTTQSIALTDATPGGNWTSSFPSFASVTGGVVSGIAPGATVISYTIPTGGCFVTASVSVNTLPGPITGTATVCAGGSTTTLTDGSAGGTWTSTIGFDATVSSTGLVTGLLPGNPSIVYTLPGGCTATKVVTVNPLPAAITGAPSVCAGSTTPLTDATGTGTWASSLPTIASVSGTGVVSGLSSGTTNVVYTLNGTGCAISKPMTVNSLPATKNVTGGGGFCSGSSGAHVGLSGSDIGDNYQLFYGGAISGSPLSGTGAGLDFGLFTGVGVYTVQATDNTTGCQNNMTGSATISVNPLPNPYTPSVVGTGFACAGSTGVDIILSGSDVGVYYQLVLGGVNVGGPVLGTGVGTLDLGFQPTGGTYTVNATNASTLCSAPMPGSATVNINPLPAVYNVSGGGPYCQGDTGVHINLSNSFGGVDYRVYTGGVLVNTLPGLGGAIDLGLYTIAGTYTVTAFDITSGCISNMTGSATVSINPLPTPETVTGGGQYCSGSPTPHVGLSYSESGSTYQLYVGGSTAVGIPVAGSNSGLDFGAQTPGTYTVIGKNAFGCQNNMTGSVTITMNPLPTPYNVSSGAGYCAGTTGVDVTLSSSDVGTNYQLYNGGVKVGLPKSGTGALVDFGKQTAAGTYTITAVNATTGCSNSMTGSSVITINPLPAVFTVSGGGNFCAGTGGKDVILSGSETGVSYQPFVGGVMTGGSMTGTGSSLDFAGETTGGSYTIVGTNGTTGCTSNMAGSALVTVDPVPNAYTVTVTGGGNYCAGGTGQHIGLALSTVGVDYQVLLGGSPVGSILSGTGKALDFGLFTTGGSYTIQGTNTVSGCMNNMGGSATITMNPLPIPYTLTESGTGAYCVGGIGIDIQLSGSTTGVDYQLYDGTSKASFVVPGTGSAIDFGNKTLAGTYTAIATDHVTGCPSNMTGSAMVTINAVPKVYAVTGGGTRCSFGVGDTIGLSGSEFNTNYQVYHGSFTDGSAWAGTNLPIYLGLHDTAGVYTVVATNTATGCTSNMSGNAVINVNLAVTPAVNIMIGSGTDTVCAGKMTNYTANPTNGGSTPVYVWKVNGTTSGTGSTLNYIPADGDIVSVFMTSNAVCPLPATVHDVTTMVVNPSSLPTVSVAADHSGLICPNTHVTLTATPTFPGATPSYTWIKNSIAVGTGATYAYTAGTTNDIIFAELMSSYQCRTSDFVLSNNVVETINNPILPSFTIGAYPSASIKTGQTITLKALVSNTTGAFTYQWYLNGTAMTGQTNPTLTYSYFANQDVVKCVVTSVGVCGGLPATESMLITVEYPAGVSQPNGGADVRVMPNPNKGTFTVKGSVGTTVDEEVTLEITNMLGQVVYSNKVIAQSGNLNEQIKLSNTLANGMYILNVRSGVDTKAFHFVIEQ
jgi:GEVED domain-containing protein/type IX secretion system substrate protein